VAAVLLAQVAVLAGLEDFQPLEVEAEERLDLRQVHPAQVAQALLDWLSSQPISNHGIRSN